MNDPKVVSAIPAFGWYADWNVDGAVLTAPLVCWLVYEDGSVVPQAADDTGYVDSCDDTNLIRIYNLAMERRRQMPKEAKEHWNTKINAERDEEWRDMLASDQTEVK